MLKSYFRIAWRTLTRNKVYALINVLGLALGICACLVIWLIARYEFSFDRNHPDQDRVYRINTYEKFTKDDPEHLVPCVQPDLPKAVRTEIAGVQTVAPYHVLSDAKAVIPGNGRAGAVFSSNPIVTGPEYFTIMTRDWLAGDERTALSEPFKVVLTEKIARTYFGAIPLDQIIGREIVYDDSLHVNVSGIVGEWGENTDFQFTEFISLSSADHGVLRQALQLDGGKGIPHSSRVLLKLAPKVNPDAVNAALSAIYKRKWENKFYPRISLQSLHSIHFTEYGGETEIKTANLSTLYALLSIALFILILAVINYVNLATAQSLTRDKEIGIRKVLGSTRTNVILQFLFETLLLTLLAVVLAGLFVKPVLGAFRSFIPVGVRFDPFSSSTLLFMGAITGITTLLAGLYPARMLSSYLPRLSLRGAGAPKGSEKWWLRKGLIVFQFTVSLVFIIGTLVTQRQIRYMQNKDLGFNSDAIVLLDTHDSNDSLNRVKVLEEQLRQLPGITEVARENMPPMGMDRGIFTIQYKEWSDERIPVDAIKADEHFIPLYKIRLLAGRNLLPSDTIKELVINESLAKRLGFNSPEKALGKRLYTWRKSVPIVGVVADFHEASLHEAIKPLLITSMACTDMAIRLETRGRSTGEVKALLAKVEKQWKRIYPHTPFDFTFLDDSLAQLYKKEQTTAWLLNIATGITIFISCIGLFGLTMFTAARRTREIGIRKVLGASVPDIATLLSKDFVFLVSIALLIASPIAWIFMHSWLRGFAYRIPIGIDIFLIAGGAILFITLLTVGFQSIKAALVNPIKSLRTE